MGLPVNWWLLAPGTLLLGLAAWGGYRLGRRRHRRVRPAPVRGRNEVERALWLVNDLEGAAERLDKVAAVQAKAAGKFARRLARYEGQSLLSLTELYDRCEEMRKPTDRLLAEISNAYAELQQQMAHLSTFAELRTDPLTGAANRLALDEKVALLLDEQTRATVTLSLAAVDVDFFKQVNDSRCLLKGDRVLANLAKLLRTVVRQCDVVARYAGEEFMIVMPHTELWQAAEVAEQIRTAVQAKMSITVSIGVAASAHGDTPNTLLNRADAALVRAKTAGRNCVYLHEGTMGHIVGVKQRTAPKPASVGAKTCSNGDKTIVEELRRCVSGGGRSNPEPVGSAMPSGSSSGGR